MRLSVLYWPYQSIQTFEKKEILCVIQNLHHTNRLKSRSCIFRRAWVPPQTDRFCTVCRLRVRVRCRFRYPACRMALRLKTGSLPERRLCPATMNLPFVPKTHSARPAEALFYRSPREISAARRLWDGQAGTRLPIPCRAKKFWHRQSSFANPGLPITAMDISTSIRLGRARTATTARSCHATAFPI